jgi:cytosine permease
MLWFVFWQDLAKGPGTPEGVLGMGLGPALTGLILGAVICHFIAYMAPAMLGMKTGLPLYVVGTSTYGMRGGLFMPGFLMGLLQFGWLGVNAFAVGGILCTCFGLDPQVPGLWHGLIATLFVIIAAVVGLKGIQYVAGIATYLPLIPVAVIIVLLANTWSGLGSFNPAQFRPEGLDPNIPSLGSVGVIAFLVTYVVGFFATAGAAGVDIASNSRNIDDVHIGGLTGIVLPTVLAGEAVLLIIVGAYNLGLVQPEHIGNMNPVQLMPDILGTRYANIAMIGLAIASFPGACFSSFIAANSFKTTMPKIHPFLSVGIGAALSAILAVSGWAGHVIPAFQVIGASFGPVCGAMLADFFLAGRRWSGPRAGFNPAGWISWVLGLIVGSFNLMIEMLMKTDLVNSLPWIADWQNYVPVPPVAAMAVGFVFYLVLSMMGARSELVNTRDAFR